MKVILINIDRDEMDKLNDIRKYCSDHEDVDLYTIITFDDMREENPYICAMTYMVDYMREYYEYTTGNIYKDTKVLIIPTDIYSNISELFKDDKEFDRYASYLYKSFKMAGCRRPDQFILYNGNEKLSPTRERLITHDLNESELGDSLVIRKQEHLGKVLELIESFSSPECTFCKIDNRRM